MSDILKWGILGCSKFALEHMLPAMQLAKNNKCIAIATSDNSKAKPFLEINSDINIYNDYNKLLNDTNVDAVYIPLPNHLHVEWTKRAILAGKHVLCEKPIALNAKDIDELIQLRDQTGLHVAEAYMILHHPQWTYAKKLLKSGAIGNLVQVDGVFSYNNANDRNNIRNHSISGGGSLLDIGVYTFGSTRFMTDEDPEKITQASIN
ncbi:Gfo/Idh/MocA family oxidoreductase, partial [Amylibacter sp.]|nr:Gfo/Idh/MocA family oxidoreductase [Amylibacter sp.]